MAKEAPYSYSDTSDVHLQSTSTMASQSNANLSLYSQSEVTSNLETKIEHSTSPKFFQPNSSFVESISNHADFPSDAEPYTSFQNSSINNFITSSASENSLNSNLYQNGSSTFYQPYVQFPKTLSANTSIVKTVLVCTSSLPSVSSSNTNLSYTINKVENNSEVKQFALIPVQDVKNLLSGSSNVCPDQHVVQSPACINPTNLPKVIMDDENQDKINVSCDRTTNSFPNNAIPQNNNSAVKSSTNSEQNINQTMYNLFRDILHAIPQRKRVLDVNHRNLYNCLRIPLEVLVKQDPESTLFRYPVEDQNCFRIVKNPMSFMTIQSKLNTFQYKDPWEFINDVWLIFNNAWSYYKKSSRQDRYANKLSKLFSQVIDGAMHKLGYCCGQRYVFEPKVLLCYNKANCYIAKNDKYWSFEDKYFLCKKCYVCIESEFVVSLTPEENLVLKKEQFVEKKNDLYKNEPFVACTKCNRKFHKICVLHYEEIWKDGYICVNCLNQLYKIRKIPFRYTSESLQQTKLSSFLENLVNNFLKQGNCDFKVTIRVLCQEKKELEVKPGAKSRFVDTGIWPASFPYTAKTLFAFQKLDGSDVCFFSMLVQEYDSTCPKPNQRHVYISYLDSVNFFTPKHLRTSVYYQILLGYLQYVKSQGFTTVHLWSCPSNKGEDYIFYCHPLNQKNPSVKKLQEWYKKMLEKGISEGIVMSYKHLFKQAVDDNIKNVCELPYFDGDYWPSVIENEIAKLEGKAEKELSVKRSAMLEETDQEGKVVSLLEVEKLTSGYKIKKCFKAPKHSILPFTGDALTDKVYATMAKYKETFIVIHLWPAGSSPECTVNDADPPITSSLISYRDSFLEFCRERDCEFSTLRRAKYSTMVILYELHKESIDTVTCNICKAELEVWHQCTVCKDFDLCINCYNLRGHEHTMDKLQKDTKSFSGYEDKATVSLDVPGFVRIMNHVSCCNNIHCPLQNCRSFKCFDNHFNVALSRKETYGFSFRWYLKQVIDHHINMCKYDLCKLNACKVLKSVRMKKLANIRLHTGPIPVDRVPIVKSSSLNTANVKCDTAQNPVYFSYKDPVPKIETEGQNNIEMQSALQSKVSIAQNSIGNLVVISKPLKTHNFETDVKFERLTPDTECQSYYLPDSESLNSSIEHKTVPFGNHEKLTYKNSTSSFDIKPSFQLENKSSVSLNNGFSFQNLKTVSSNSDGKPVSVRHINSCLPQSINLPSKADFFNEKCNPHFSHHAQTLSNFGPPLSSVSKRVPAPQVKNLMHSGGYGLEVIPIQSQCSSNSTVFTGSSSELDVHSEISNTVNRNQPKTSLSVSANNSNCSSNSSDKISVPLWVQSPVHSSQDALSTYSPQNKKIKYFKINQSQAQTSKIQSSDTVQFCDNVLMVGNPAGQVTPFLNSVQNHRNLVYDSEPPSYNSYLVSESYSHTWNKSGNESRVPNLFHSDTDCLNKESNQTDYVPASDQTVLGFPHHNNEPSQQNLPPSFVPVHNYGYESGNRSHIQPPTSSSFNKKYVYQNVSKQSFLENAQQSVAEEPREIKSEVLVLYSKPNVLNSNFAVKDTKNNTNLNNIVRYTQSAVNRNLQLNSSESPPLNPVISSSLTLPKFNTNTCDKIQYHNDHTAFYGAAGNSSSANVPYTSQSSTSTAFSTSGVVQQQSYNEPQNQVTLKGLLNSRNHPLTNQQEQHILNILNNNPQNKLQTTLKKRALEHHLEQRKKQVFLNDQAKENLLMGNQTSHHQHQSEQISESRFSGSQDLNLSSTIVFSDTSTNPDLY